MDDNLHKYTNSLVLCINLELVVYVWVRLQSTTILTTQLHLVSSICSPYQFQNQKAQHHIACVLGVPLEAYHATQ